MVIDGWALPDSLLGATFTTSEASAAGVGKRRLRSERTQRVLRGVWAGAEVELTFAQRCAAALSAVERRGRRRDEGGVGDGDRPEGGGSEGGSAMAEDGSQGRGREHCGRQEAGGEDGGRQDPGGQDAGREDARREDAVPDDTDGAGGSRPGAWISHASAATLLELPLPPRLRELDAVDVTVRAPRRAPRAKGIHGRQRDAQSASTALLHGMPVSTAAQAFVDGCDYLSFEDLVAIGDASVQGQTPLTSVQELLAAIDRHAGQRSHHLLLRAAREIHPRSRSRPETITRLQLREFRTHEPWCNVPVLIDEGAAIAPDLAFWPAGLVIEVEGDHHRVDRKQWLVDLDRYNRLQRNGIEVHRVVATTVETARRRLTPIVERIRQRWDPARPIPRIAPFFDGPPTVGPWPWLPIDH